MEWGHLRTMPDNEYVRTDGKWLVDGSGRVFLFHGVNLGNKQPPFLPWASRQDVMALREWGFNSVRLFITWEAVEPAPGKHDDAFLDKVAERLAWCREAGVKVVIDMHQDLYSRRYGGDGAPDWACLDEGMPNTVPGDSWFLGYLSPAVQRAFDNLWANKAGPDGIGIQDRFVAMWQYVARRFRDDTNVLGYDILNEPAYGERLNAVIGGLTTAIGSELGVRPTTVLSVSSAAGMAKTIQALLQKGALSRVLDLAGPLNQRAERATLQPFYDRLTAAIRAVDPHHIIFFEPAFGDLSGTKVPTGLEAPKDAQRQPFPNVVFAPHFYDFSIGYELLYDPAVARPDLFLGRAKAAGDRMRVPTWFGEWGSIHRHPNRTDLDLGARDQLDAFDKMLCGWAYWAYWGPDFRDFRLLPLMTRPYAETIAGEPLHMRTTNDKFELDFIPQTQGGETVIWAPLDRQADIKVNFAGNGTARVVPGGPGLVSVICSPGASRCTVTVSLSPR